MQHSTPDQQSLLYQQVTSNPYCNMSDISSITNTRSPPIPHLLPPTPPPPILSCTRCNWPFQEYEDMACTGQDKYWHLGCFVCAQCFRPFGKELEYYEFEGRNYCERDFRTLFAPCCSKCDHYINGRFIRALNKCWHPNCFLCNRCSCPLADQGFIKKGSDGALCHTCNILEKSVTKNKYTCYKCKLFIETDEDGPPLRYKNETYHSYHFNCHACGIELRPDARQVNGDLYCLKCHDKMDIPICGACRRPIEERVVTALGKHWHNEHFACATCEKPFLGKRHYEVKGLAYCEQDYYQTFGRTCCTCSKAICGDVLLALDKYYCSEHFCCHNCHTKLTANKSKFFDVESRPCCKKCYKKIPASLRRQLAKKKKEQAKSIVKDKD